MAGVPYVFASATTSIPLSQLDADFNTPVTIGNTSVGLGNTVTSFGNVTLVNPTLTSANVSISGGTANGVVYINSSNVAVASPTVLSFTGTNLGVGTSTPTSPSGFAQNVTLYNATNAAYVVNANNAYRCEFAVSSGGGWLSTYDSIPLRFATSNTEVARFTTTGNLSFTTSNAGIVFNNSSALANSTLNDYETGTWTPTLTPGGGTLTAYTSAGTYTKVGRNVFINGYVSITTAGTASGAMIVGALPFTTASVVNGRSYEGVVREDNVTGTSYASFVSGSSTVLQIISFTGTTPPWTNNYVYTFSATYPASF